MPKNEWLAEITKNNFKNKIKNNLELALSNSQLSPEVIHKAQKAIHESAYFRNEGEAVSNTPEAESELHAAINPVDSNNIIVSGMKWTPSSLGYDLTFPIYFTNDFGQTWELSDFNGIGNLPMTTIPAGGGDPIIVFDSNGTAYMSWLLVILDANDFVFKFSLEWAISADGGQTWIQQSPIEERPLTDLFNPQDPIVDKEWMAVDHSGGAFHDHIYIAYTEITPDGDNAAYDILLKHKALSDSTFTEDFINITQNEFEFAHFSSIDVGSDGTVHLMFMGSKFGAETFELYHSKSNDGGLTFTTPQIISVFEIPCLLPNQMTENCPITGIEPERFYPCNHLKVDQSKGAYDGNIYSVWTANGVDSIASAGTDIYFSKSEDGGDTWTAAIILNDDDQEETEQFFPSLDVNEQGTLIITWYDRREDTANVLTKYYMTYSEDGGNSFVPNFPVSSESSDFSAIGNGNGNFGIGEYTQVISTPCHAIPFWADGRTNDGNIEIYTSRIALGCEGIVGIEELNTLSNSFSIQEFFPNPASDQVNIKLELQEDSHFSIQIIQTDGTLVKEVCNQSLASGSHELQFTVKDLAQGSYFCVFKSAKGVRSKSFVTLKK